MIEEIQEYEGGYYRPGDEIHPISAFSLWNLGKPVFRASNGGKPRLKRGRPSQLTFHDGDRFFNPIEVPPEPEPKRDRVRELGVELAQNIAILFCANGDEITLSRRGGTWSRVSEILEIVEGE